MRLRGISNDRVLKRIVLGLSKMSCLRGISNDRVLKQKLCISVVLFRLRGISNDRKKHLTHEVLGAFFVPENSQFELSLLNGCHIIR